eukprot:TRINITY_DN17535_c0_g1_i2.p2 TRINITY_DN17535_c0_g1~~TRINITY_DN17535_c0_g1_i2.p2  ORF type:complete len:144 (+),score=27.60 TRINITY_DN17535_c0_g1_i2:11-442(+)
MSSVGSAAWHGLLTSLGALLHWEDVGKLKPWLAATGLGIVTVAMTLLLGPGDPTAGDCDCHPARGRASSHRHSSLTDSRDKIPDSDRSSQGQQEQALKHRYRDTSAGEQRKVARRSNTCTGGHEGGSDDLFFNILEAYDACER